MSGNESECQTPKRQIFTVALKNSKKSAVRLTIEKPILLIFVNLLTIF